MNCRNLTRRDVLKLSGTAAISAAGVYSAHAATPFSMPGLYRGRVIGVEHSGSSINNVYQTVPIQTMIRRGMMELTGLSNYIAAWRKLFQPGDVVGIKVNPSGGPAIISSQPCLLEIINGLLLAGVAPTDIVVFDRYEWGIQSVAGWLPPWVRTAFASPVVLDDQTDISGYDPDHYVDLPQYLLPWQSPNNPAHTRSYAALYITRQVTKVISLAVLKDHCAAGVTMNLKNLSIGCFNNANRFHPDVHTNYLLNAIPALVAAPVIRNKVVLGITDGVHCLCNGGPVTYSDPEYGFISEHKTMYFATDVVASDRICWLAIDAERAKKGLPAEEVAGPDAYDPYDVRQPQHIEVAGQMGLGEWRDSQIDFRKVTLA
jgi:hypothetical protein